MPSYMFAFLAHYLHILQDLQDLIDLLWALSKPYCDDVKDIVAMSRWRCMQAGLQ